MGSHEEALDGHLEILAHGAQLTEGVLVGVAQTLYVSHRARGDAKQLGKLLLTDLIAGAQRTDAVDDFYLIIGLRYCHILCTFLPPQM